MTFVHKVGPLDWMVVAKDIAADAKAEDVREWETASDGEPFLVSLTRAVQMPNVWAVWSDLRAIAVFGVSPLGRGALGWLTLTNEAAHKMLSLHKLFLKFLEDLPHEYISCWADSRNALHLRWLERVGFEGGAITKHNGADFICFTYTKETPQVCASRY